VRRLVAEAAEGAYFGRCVMLGKRKEPKRKSIAMTLMRDVQGSAADKSRAAHARVLAVA
jgi:hypothetical protein